MVCVGCNRERKLRFKKRTTCSSCYSLEWSRNNRERRRELDRRSYAYNATERKQKVIAHQAANHEDALRYKKVWRDRNPHYSSAHRALKLQATPPWSDLAKIKEIYRQRPKGHHVDHIIPLKGKNVCGLHVPHNLQYLPAKQNLSKGNRI